MEHLEEYKKHCIDQAVTVLTANHNIKCMFGTPKLIESLCLGLEERGTTLAKLESREFFPVELSSRHSGHATAWKSCSAVRPKRVEST